jgi:PAS domain S-box-containing protein
MPPRKRNRLFWLVVVVMIAAIAGLGTHITQLRDKAIAIQQARDEQHLRAELIVLSAPAALVTCNAAGNITLFNPAACKLFGYAPEDVLGKSIDILMPEHIRKPHAALVRNAVLQTLRHGDDHYVVYCRDVKSLAVMADGTTRPLTISVRLIKYGEHVEFIAVMRDATESLQPAMQAVPLPPVDEPTT